MKIKPVFFDKTNISEEKEEKEETVSLETIDPATAEYYLSLNEKNRNPSMSKVSRYSRDMESNRWGTGDSAIVFDWNGRLINGQHRLMAIIRSGKAQKCIVRRGADPEEQTVMDRGLQRTFTGDLQIRGVENATWRGPVINALWEVLYNKKSAVATDKDRMSLLEEFEEPIKFVESMVYNFKKQMPGDIKGTAPYHALVVLLASKDRKKAELFYEITAVGLDCPKEGYLRSLRNLLSSKTVTGARAVAEVSHKSAKAILYFVKGDNLGILRDDGPGVPELFEELGISRRFIAETPMDHTPYSSNPRNIALRDGLIKTKTTQSSAARAIAERLGLSYKGIYSALNKAKNGKVLIPSRWDRILSEFGIILPE